MKKRIFIGCILFFTLCHGYSQNTITIPENSNKILFLGNSITYSGQYISYIETYLTLQYPNRKIEFINVGLPSETVSGLSEPNHANGKFPRPDLHERLHRILSQIKPDLVFTNYGMNDGIYMPFDNVRFQKFKEGIRWMHNLVIKSDALIIHLTPPVYDGSNAKVYDHVLDVYSNWLISQRDKVNWQVIDVHWPMKKLLEKKRRSSPSFKFAQDGVHPGELGHWVIAKQTLLSLDEKEVFHMEDPEEMLAYFVNGEAILELVEKRQALTKDTWLTTIGHKRPGMNVGLPLEEAQHKANEWEERIRKLMVN